MQKKIRLVLLYLIMVLLILLLIGGCVRSRNFKENTSVYGGGNMTRENETLNFDI